MSQQSINMALTENLASMFILTNNDSELIELLETVSISWQNYKTLTPLISANKQHIFPLIFRDPAMITPQVAGAMLLQAIILEKQEIAAYILDTATEIDLTLTEASNKTNALMLAVQQKMYAIACKAIISNSPLLQKNASGEFSLQLIFTSKETELIECAIDRLRMIADENLLTGAEAALLAELALQAPISEPSKSDCIRKLFQLAKDNEALLPATIQYADLNDLSEQILQTKYSDTCTMLQFGTSEIMFNSLKQVIIHYKDAKLKILLRYEADIPVYSRQIAIINSNDLFQHYLKTISNDRENLLEIALQADRNHKNTRMV